MLEGKEKPCRPKSFEWWSPNFNRLALMCSSGFLLFKKEREDSARSRRVFISTSPCHWVCERLVHCQGDFFFYPWFHMVWTGLHVAPHATANVFSIRCLISRELASDEACWQRNGRESFRRLHQMAALLRHLGQNLVDGELAAGAAFFFFSLFYFPSLFDKMSQTSHSSNSHLIFFTLFSEAASHCFLLPPSLCHSEPWVPRKACPAFPQDSVWESLRFSFLFVCFLFFLREYQKLGRGGYFSQVDLGV